MREDRQSRKRVSASECVHCHICRENCEFLSKYKIDIGDRKELEKLAYHCFLCGRCTQVCPIGIDGREEVLNIRQERAKKCQGQPGEKGYGMLLLEKRDYLFRNYRKAEGESVLFPGCNFPSFFPETTRKLAGLLREKAGMGVVYDCCGKPVAELGLKEQEARILRGIEERLSRRGVTEVVVLCPNCYYFLRPRLNVRVVGIYEKLRELGLGGKIPGGASVFLPCPDRETLKWLKDIRPFFAEECGVIQSVQCCGLGGCAGIKEPELAASMAGKAAEAAAGRALEEEPEGKSGERRNKERGILYTYCGSCAGNLARNGCGNVQHVLSEILGVHERPDTCKSMLNRMKTKLW